MKEYIINIAVFYNSIIISIICDTNWQSQMIFLIITYEIYLAMVFNNFYKFIFLN